MSDIKQDLIEKIIKVVTELTSEVIYEKGLLDKYVYSCIVSIIIMI